MTAYCFRRPLPARNQVARGPNIEQIRRDPLEGGARWLRRIVLIESEQRFPDPYKNRERALR